MPAPLSCSLAPLRVGFVVPFVTPTGGIRVVFEFAERLSQRGHEAWILHLEHPSPLVSRTRLRRTWRNLIHQSLGRSPASWFPRIRNYRSIPWTSTGADLPELDIVVATTWDTTPWLMRVEGKRLAKAYYVQHHESLWADSPEEADATYRLPLHKLAVSRWLTDLMRSRFGQECEQVRCGLDLLETPPPAVRSTPPPDFPRVLLMHHSIPLKGFADGLRAIEAVREKCRGFKLKIFGHAKCPQGIPAADYVREPSRTELCALYDATDIFVWPSTSEGLGLPPMEAMSRGCAVFTRPNGGSRDFSNHSVTTWETPDHSLESLTAGLTHLATDPQLCLQLGNRAQDMARREFGWEDATTRMETVLAKLAKSIK